MKTTTLIAVALMGISPAVAGEAILEGKTQAFECQLKTLSGYMMPYDVTAVDQVTGVVLFSAKAGDILPETLCINAPGGHEMLVSGDGVPSYTPVKK